MAQKSKTQKLQKWPKTEENSRVPNILFYNETRSEAKYCDQSYMTSQNKNTFYKLVKEFLKNFLRFSFKNYPKTFLIFELKIGYLLTFLLFLRKYEQFSSTFSNNFL